MAGIQIQQANKKWDGMWGLESWPNKLLLLWVQSMSQRQKGMISCGTSWYRSLHPLRYVCLTS